jgi:hypothetical protein
MKFLLQTSLLLLALAYTARAQNFTSNTGKIKFTSDAPLELIKAESGQTMCVISGADKKFAFKVKINSFEGFNDPLQKEHFRENYMESEKYPFATFSGKIIEDVDLSKSGTYNVRAKGMMNIHGVEKEKIVKARIIVKENSCEIDSAFDIPLADHNIKVPKVVNQKIASVIFVDCKASLALKK